MSARLARTCAAAAFSALAACSSSVGIPEDARITCQSTSDCPPGRLCHAGECFRPEAIDTTPPDLASSPAVTPAIGDAGTSFTIDVVPTEPLLDPPKVMLGLVPPVSLTCGEAVPGVAGAYRCTYVASGSENGGAGGVVPFSVSLVDLGRNETTRNQAGALLLDFAPPGIATASVAYVPGPGNPLATVKNAGANTTIRVAVSADELLDSASPPSFAASLGVTTLAFQLVPGSLSGTGAVFEATVPALPPIDTCDGTPSSCPPDATCDGGVCVPPIWCETPADCPPDHDCTGICVPLSPACASASDCAAGEVCYSGQCASPSVFGIDEGAYVGRLTWTDVAGNQGTVQLTDPAIRVKLSPPALAVDQTQVTYVRDPWGHTAWAGPVFELGPADPLSGATSLPASTFTIGSGAPEAVRAWYRPSPLGGPSLLATIRPNPDGTWPRTQLPSVDAPVLEVTALDDAGNESWPEAIANVEWIATANPPPYGTSPHSADASSYLSETLVPAPDTSLAASPVASLSLPDGSFYTARADVAIRRVGSTAGPGAVTASSSAAMAYDAGRGRTVVLTGNAGSRTTEWDGIGWTDRTPFTAVPVGISQAMAYDAARGRVVTYDGTSRESIFEWDGAAWTLFAQTIRPGRRVGHRLAYDAGRGKIVLFGGATDTRTWEWNGASWTAWTTPTAPPAVVNPGMAYDVRRGRVVLFGGCPAATPSCTGTAALSDVWEYDGTTWTNAPQSGALPGARRGHVMAYDARKQRVVLFGGFDATNVNRSDVREWDGSTWTDVTPAAGSPPAALDRMAAFDTARARLVVVQASETWEWDGAGWLRRAPRQSVPFGGTIVSLTGHRLAFDERRGRAVLFGGFASSRTVPPAAIADVWEWDGSQWASLTPSAGAAPAARYSHSMTYDPDAQRVVVFGGVTATAALNDLWEWSGTGWAQRATAGGPPPARYGAGVAFDRSRHALVLFGGNTFAGTRLDDTWELSGPVGGTWTWTQKANPPPAALTPRTGHSLLFDGTRTLAFYGLATDPFFGNLYEADVWAWNGSAWSDATPPFGSGGPMGRGRHAMAWDPLRGRAFFFGGYTFSSGWMDDAWQWDGSRFQSMAQPPGATWPTDGAEVAMTFDSARSRAVQLGVNGDTWEWDSDLVSTGSALRQRRTPMVQLTVGYAGAGFAPAQVVGLRVRARAAGRFGAAGAGATLLGWMTGSPGTEGGEWVPLAANADGTTIAPGTLAWDASPATLPFFLVTRDSKLAFQLRPAGASAPSEPESSVLADYLEVRVRYRTQ